MNCRIPGWCWRISQCGEKTHTFDARIGVSKEKKKPTLPFSIRILLNKDNDSESDRLDAKFKEYLSCLGEMVCRVASHLSLQMISNFGGLLFYYCYFVF